MSDIGRRIQVGFWISVFSVLLVFAVVPQRYIPQRLTPFVGAKGMFTGEPVRLPAPEGRSELSTSIKVKMDKGMCLVSLEHGIAPTELFRMGEGSWSGRIPSGSSLFLDPHGNAGKYDVTIGPEWHPLAPKARRFVLLPIAIGMIVASMFLGTSGSKIKKSGAKRLTFFAATVVISGLVLYPVVHEGGHMMLGMLFGAIPNWDDVVWTPLSGVEPHVSFIYISESAVPFMAAGGYIVPTLVALLLLLIWRFIHKNASWYVSAALVSIAVLFLFSTVGCLFELYQDTHMDALSVHLGLTGPLRIACSLSPLFVAIIACSWLGTKLRKFKLGKEEIEKAGLKKPNGE